MKRVPRTTHAPTAAAASTIRSLALSPLLPLRATDGRTGSCSTRGTLSGIGGGSVSSNGTSGGRVNVCSTEAAHESDLRSDDTGAPTPEPTSRMVSRVPIAYSSGIWTGTGLTAYRAEPRWDRRLGMAPSNPHPDPARRVVSLYVLFRRGTAPVLIRAAPRVTQFRSGPKLLPRRCGIIASAPLLRYHGCTSAESTD